MTLRAGLLLLCCPLVGCATARIVRLDTGEGTPIVYTPARSVPPVEIDQRDFEKAMTTLLLEMKFSLRDEGLPHLRLASATEEAGGRYDLWCLQQSSSDECLGLLRGDLSQADASVRRQLALSFAWDGVWDGVAKEIRGMADPVMLKLMINTAFAAYIGLLILPEPVTKAVAVALTTVLIAYVGVDVFLNILDGWRELSARSERARSIGELEDAGHRFGGVMGRDGARVIIMALTAALGGGAAHFASKAPMLPGFPRAVLRARTNAGFELSVVLEGGARSVTVAEGVMTVGVAPNAVAAVAAGPPGGAIRPGGLGSGAAKGLNIPDKRAGHIFRDAPGHLKDTPANRQLLQEVGSDPAARLGTDKFGNTWSARTNPDGTQTWVQSRGGDIINGGVNQTPRTFHPETGLSAPAPPGG